MNIPFIHHHNNGWLDRAQLPPMHQLASHIRQLQQHDPQAARQQLDRLLTAYCFRHLGTHGQAAPEPALLDALYQPARRAALIGSLCIDMAGDMQADGSALRQRLQTAMPALRASHRQHCPKPQAGALLAADHDLDRQRALLITSTFSDHCLHDAGYHEHVLFHCGIDNALLALQLARQQGQHPLYAFLATLLQYLALVYIQQRIRAASSRPDPVHLLHAIGQLDRRLAYWISKDWGLPDVLLDLLRQCLPGQHTGPAAQLVLHSEHVWLLLRLQQQQLLSRHQTRRLLSSMQLPDDARGCLH